jgi:AcrR family transcriptional regulator
MPYPSQITPESIIQKAAEMGEQDGVEQLSLAKLASALGVKAPSLYRHVSNKDALLQAVNLQTLQRLFAEFEAALASVGGDAAEQLTAVLLAALIIYNTLDYSWLTFALFILAPDLTAVGYLINTRIGSITYNLGHIYAVPITIAIIALWLNWPLGIQIALIWAAHIGMDRLVGYGLKYPDNFKHTHLNQI